jgi:hypothetical protein
MADINELICAFEAGELEDPEIFEMFQSMINSGLAYRLQGSYGRTAEALISSGDCHDPQPGEAGDDELSESEDAYHWSPACSGVFSTTT